MSAAAGGAGASAVDNTSEGIWTYIYNASKKAAILEMRNKGYSGLTEEYYNTEFVKIAEQFALMDRGLKMMGATHNELLRTAPNKEGRIVLSAKKENVIKRKRGKLGVDSVEALITDIAWKASWHATLGATHKLIGETDRDTLEKIHKTVFSIWKSHLTDLNDMVTAFCIAALGEVAKISGRKTTAETDTVLNFAAREIYHSSLFEGAPMINNNENNNGNENIIGRRNVTNTTPPPINISYINAFMGVSDHTLFASDIALASKAIHISAGENCKIVFSNKILIIEDGDNRRVFTLPTFNQKDEMKEAIVDNTDSTVVSFSTLFFHLLVNIPKDETVSCQMTLLLQPRDMKESALMLYMHDIPCDLAYALGSIASGEAIATGASGGRRRSTRKRTQKHKHKHKQSHKHKRKTHRRRATRKTAHRRKH